MKRIALILGALLGLSSTAAAAQEYVWDPTANYDTDFEALTQVIAPVYADSIQFTDGFDGFSTWEALVHSHSGAMTWSITATIDGNLTNIYTGTFNSAGSTDISDLGLITFAGGTVTSVGFTSSPFQFNSFHGFLDGTYAAQLGPNATPTTFTLGSSGAVPEPGTWAMMLLGFGATGFAMRRRKGSPALAQIA